MLSALIISIRIDEDIGISIANGITSTDNTKIDSGEANGTKEEPWIDLELINACYSKVSILMFHFQNF